jgi:hypothetical protein
VALGVALMAAGMVLSGDTVWPLVHPDNLSILKSKADYWTMSQRAGSISYTLFGAGFSSVLYLGFRSVCDSDGLRWCYFELLGRHALVVYVAHGMVMDCVKPFVPKDSPLWFVLLGFGVNLLMVTLIVRFFDRHKLWMKL